MQIHPLTFPLLKPHYRLFFTGIILGVIGIIAYVLFAWNLALLLAAFLHDTHKYNKYTLLALLSIFLMIKFICTLVQEIIFGKICINIKSHLRAQILNNNNKIENNTNFNTLFTFGIDNLDNYFKNYLPTLFYAVLYPLIYGITVLFADITSGIILFVTAPLLPFFLSLIGHAAKSRADSQWKSFKILSAKFFDILQGLTTLKSFSQNHASTLAESETTLANNTLRLLRLSFISAFVLEFAGTLSTAIIAVACGLRLLSGSINFNIAMFALLLTPEFFAAIRQLGINFHTSTIGFSVLDSLAPYLEQNKTTPQTASNKNIGDIITKLEINNLSFSFSENKSLINNLSFTVNANQWMSIWGEIGTGKSTLFKIILKIINMQQGTILLNNQTCNLSSNDKTFAWLPQKINFIYGSIKNNLQLYNPAASETEMLIALDTVLLKDKVLSLSNKLDTNIGENGLYLSLGERQRLALARTLLCPAHIFLLDEPTAHLDSNLEEQILTRIKAYLNNKIVLVATHRKFLHDFCDTHVYLPNGTAP